MICNLLVIDISCFCNIFVGSHFQNLICRPVDLRISAKAGNVFVNFFCNRSGKHPGICSGIGHQLFLIKLLNDPQGFIRTDLKKPGADVLKLRQVKKKRRILVFFFPLDFFYLTDKRRILTEFSDQLLCVLFFFKTVFLIKIRRPKIPAALHSPPLAVKVFALKGNTAKNPVKRCFYKGTDFPLSSYNHSKNTGHYTTHGNSLIFCFQIVGHTVSISQGQNTGKINSHKVVLLCPEISRCRKIIIL